MLAIVDLLTGKKKLRKDLDILDKVFLGIAFGTLVFVGGVFGYALFLVASIQAYQIEDNSPTPFGWEVEAERQRPMVIGIMKCDDPMAEPADGITRETTKVMWSCTGYCGTYDMHYYEQLSDGTTTAVCSGDYDESSRQKVEDVR